MSTPVTTSPVASSMPAFTKVLIVVSVVLLGVYYYRQYKSFKEEQSKRVWPPVTQPCPDYWIHQGNNVCKNVHQIGICPQGADGQIMPQGEVAFNTSNFTGAKGDQEKCRWSKRCQAPWEGIDSKCA